MRARFGAIATIVTAISLTAGQPVDVVRTLSGRTLAIVKGDVTPEVVSNILAGANLRPQGAVHDGGAGRRVDGIQFGELGTLLFEFDSAYLRPEGVQTLGQICTVFQDESLESTRLLVAGHTDAIGGTGYNQRLSEARAKTAAVHLKRCLGVERVSFIGRGESDPISHLDPTDARQRRVEISVLPKRLVAPGRGAR